jgi:acylphosphatase
VRNLPDGRVELLADGPPEAVEAFLAEIHDEMAGCIRSEDVFDRDGDDTLDGFHITR